MKKFIQTPKYEETIVCDACGEPDHQDDGLIRIEVGTMYNVGPDGKAPFLKLDLHHGCTDSMRARILGK